jgi:hypothetical protein
MDDSRNVKYSRFPEIEDLITLCRSLNEHQVKYLLIGGFAVILQGFTRTTKDIDLLIDSSAENIRKLKKALAYLPDNAISEVQDDDLVKMTVVRVADEIVIDLMAKACGIDFQRAVKDREYIKVEDVQVPVPSPSTLIRMKETYRPSDQMDVEFLKTLLQMKKNGGSVTRRKK